MEFGGQEAFALTRNIPPGDWVAISRRLRKVLAHGPIAGSESNVTYYDHLKIDLGKGIVFSAYVGFTEGMDAMAIGLLGQDGFFDRYNVEFRNAEGIFTVENAGD